MEEFIQNSGRVLLRKFFLVLVLTVSFSPASALAQEEPEQGEQRAEGNSRNAREERPKIKPYQEIVTQEAITEEGIFKVHRVDKKTYYEIPETELGKDFLWVSRIARTPEGVGYGGQKVGTHVVRWERNADRVLLREVSYSIVADSNRPEALAVEAANNGKIVKSFDIRALGPNNAPVIEINPLFETEITEFSARSRLQARGFDRSRSFLEQILVFPENIEVRATHTFTRPPEQQPSRPAPPNPFLGAGMSPGSATVLMHYSMVKLPEVPMMPRLFDPRVGYFSVGQTDFGREEHRAQERRYITRWRLVKKDPTAELSQPVKPIVYWIDPATPVKWREYVRRGVENWQEAFEAAGFKQAIIARQGPTPEEDPRWHPEDARYSVIRWLPSSIENASGPHVHDPRTGEILESDIQFYHNVQNLLRSWYFLQVAPLDPRAQKLPIPDDLMGELIEYVVAHEVGHTLGFQHNMKASSTYPLKKVRDPEWVKKMGHTPTLMDYSRFNYVAQPGDGIPARDLIPKIGPYDKWATMWGYKPIPAAATPDQEKETLDAWARQQDETPWLRFSTRGARGADPGDLTEAVGDADAVEATRLGLANLEKVTELLLVAASKEGEDWTDLEELYGRLLGQWVREMNHVASLVGGFDSRQVHAGQPGLRFEPVDRQRQIEALDFLNASAFQTPQFLIRPEILRRIEPYGVLSRIETSQRAILNSLLNEERFKRLVEQSALDGQPALSPGEFLNRLEQGVWSELDLPSKIKIDAFRRNLQRAFLQVVDSRINDSDEASEMRAFLRGELVDLEKKIGAALDRTEEEATRFHLQDLRMEITQILDPRFPRSKRGGSQEARRSLDLRLEPPPVSEDGFPLQACWPDLIIGP